jgi:preprotein translocase subunit SecD
MISASSGSSEGSNLSDRPRASVRGLLSVSLRLAPVVLAAGLLAACDVQPELPCWAEVRIDFVAHPAAEPVTPTILAEVTAQQDARLADYGIELRNVFTYGVDRIAVGLEERSATEQTRSLLSASGRLALVPLPPDVPVPAEGDVPPPLQPLIDHDQVLVVQAVDDEAGPALDIELSVAGAQALAGWSRTNIGGTLVLLIDGRVLATPTLRTPIEDGRLRLSGLGFSADRVRLLAALLSHGPLLLDLELVSWERVETPPCPEE